MSKWRIVGWTSLVAALFALGWTLYVWLPPQPRWVVSGSYMTGGLAPDGKTYRMLTVPPGREPRRTESPMLVPEPRVSGVKILDLESGREITHFLGEPQRQWETVFSDDGRRLAAIATPTRKGGPSEIRVIDLSTGQERCMTIDHDADHWRVSFSPKGELVMVEANWSHEPVTLFLCDAENLRQIAKLTAREWWSRKWAKDREALLVFEPRTAGDALLRRISRDGETIIPFKGAGDWLDITPDGKTVITEPPAKDDKWPRVVDSLLVWDLGIGKLRHTIPVANFHPRAPGDPLFCDANRTLRIRHGAPRPGNLLAVWDIDQEKWLGEISVSGWHEIVVPEQNLFAVSSPKEVPGTVTLYQARPFRKLWQREWPGKVACGGRSSGRSRLLVSISDDPPSTNRLEWLDIKTGETRVGIGLDRKAGTTWRIGSSLIALTEWHYDRQEHNPIVQWLDAHVLPLLFPTLPRSGEAPTTTRVIDTESGTELCRIDLMDAEGCNISSDGRSLFIDQEAPLGGQARLYCYDVPPHRAWQYILGIPTAVGLMLVMANFGWRHWCGRKTTPSVPYTTAGPAPGPAP